VQAGKALAARGATRNELQGAPTSLSPLARRKRLSPNEGQAAVMLSVIRPIRTRGRNKPLKQAAAYADFFARNE
jgi:hypothetical protein